MIGRVTPAKSYVISITIQKKNWGIILSSENVVYLRNAVGGDIFNCLFLPADGGSLPRINSRITVMTEKDVISIIGSILGAH